MSRIFDALQRSAIEQSGIEYPDAVSVATEVFEAMPEPAMPDAVTANLGEALREIPVATVVAEAPTLETLKPEITVIDKAKNAAADFPSLHVSVTSASRLVFFSEPDSLAAEKFRFLAVRLLQFRQRRTLKKVLVTSSIPEEGKSLVAANVAGALARRKERVLLLEGDLRRPVQAQQFGLGRLAGLGEWLLSGEQTVSNIYHLGGPGFWLMPAGDPPPNPLELMQSGRLSPLMSQLSNMFDWIIVDSPPLLPLADTTVWSRMTEGTLLVTREGKTEKGALEKALEAIKTSDLLGVVLNGCSNPDHDNYYQRYSPPAKK